MCLMNSVLDVSNELLGGSHVIVGCDQSDTVDRLVAAVNAEAQELAVIVVSLDEALSEEDVTRLIRIGCAGPGNQIGMEAPNFGLEIDECVSNRYAANSGITKGILFQRWERHRRCRGNGAA